MEGKQKSITVKLYPKEVEALEIVAKLAGWDGKSTALREFMKIWLEAAVVGMETKSATRGTWQMVKSVQRINKQMKAIEKSTGPFERTTIMENDLAIIKEALAG